MNTAQCPNCGRFKRVPENPLNRKLVCSCGSRFRPEASPRKTVPLIIVVPATAN